MTSQPGQRRADDPPPITATVADRLADTMFALSAPSRVLIMGCLLAGPRSVTDLTEALGMEQSAVSHQLRVLRDHNLVRAEKDGRRRLYALHDEHVAALLQAGLHHLQRGRKAAGTAAPGPSEPGLAVGDAS